MNQTHPQAGDTERVVAMVWSELLDTEVTELHESVFTLGAHSLHVTRCVARLRELLGVQLSTVTFFENPAIADFSAVIAAGPDGHRIARRAAIIVRALSPAPH